MDEDDDGTAALEAEAGELGSESDGADALEGAEVDGEHEEQVDTEAAKAALPAGVRKRIDRLTAQKKTLAEENEALKAENARLQESYDEAQLEAAKATGILPQFISAEDAAVIQEHEKAAAYRRQVNRAVIEASGNGGTFTDRSGKEWSSADLADELDRAETAAEKLQRRAARIEALAYEKQQKALESNRGGKAPVKVPGNRAQGGKVPPKVGGAGNGRRAEPAAGAAADAPRKMDFGAIRTAKDTKAALKEQIRRRRGLS